MCNAVVFNNHNSCVLQSVLPHCAVESRVCRPPSTSSLFFLLLHFMCFHKMVGVVVFFFFRRCKKEGVQVERGFQPTAGLLIGTLQEKNNFVDKIEKMNTATLQ